MLAERMPRRFLTDFKIYRGCLGNLTNCILCKIYSLSRIVIAVESNYWKLQLVHKALHDLVLKRLPKKAPVFRCNLATDKLYFDAHPSDFDLMLVITVYCYCTRVISQMSCPRNVHIKDIS